MPIDEALLTQEVLDNTLVREVLSEVRVVPGTFPKMGKVRTVYDLGAYLLMISSDNLSTHDVVHRRQVYGKGENLDAISAYFFNATKGIIPNHYAATLGPNAWLVRKAQPIMVEMVLRAFLTGSGWKDYANAQGPEKGMVLCGNQLRPGYCRNEKLDQLIVTPTTKGPARDFAVPELAGIDKDDASISLAAIRANYQAFGLRRPEDLDIIVDASLKLYGFINFELAATGNILADTKWEFGYLADGTIALIDECVTPDSSRFWSVADYQWNPAKSEFTAVQHDKQPFRDHIERLGLHKDKAALARYEMPWEEIRAGVKRYGDMRELITGTPMLITTEPVKERLLAALGAKGYLN